MSEGQKQQCDVVIIGGGAAGMMAALSIRHHHPEKAVAILDRTFELGRKLLVSGAGRGNLSNVHLDHERHAYYHGDNAFIDSVFSQFGYVDILKFFTDIGIPSYEEGKSKRGKIFPVVDNAKTVRDILVRELDMAGVTIVCDMTVQTLRKDNEIWNIQTNNGVFVATDIILACGGKTYPALGSDGSGYELAKQIGHSIVEPVPSAVPITSRNQLSHFLQGEKLIMKVTSFIDGKSVSSATGDVMFTQYGFSGPAIFDISHDISIRINREHMTDTSLELSFFPESDDEEIRNILQKRIDGYRNRPVAEILWGLFTTKASGAICAIAKFPKEKTAGSLTAQDIESLAKLFGHMVVQVDGTRGWNEAEFTAGGVATDEIERTTLRSKKAPGIYLAGELVDVDGQVGGFNLSWAWASGWVAGKLQ